jgi:dUTP pyrophosphatase
MNIRIKKLHPDAVVPVYARPGDSGFDLVSVADVIVRPGETVMVPTGLIFEIPEGYELQVRPRSGISVRTKLRVSNTPGTVDSGYRGEVCVLLDNINPLITHPFVYSEDLNGNEVEEYGKFPVGTYIIRKGDRIAQGVIAPVIRAEFEVVDELSETERGAGGFGSSGVRTVPDDAVRKATKGVMEKYRELFERLADE